MSISESSSKSQQEKTCLMVGGGSGIGLAICEMLAKRGYRCLVQSRTLKEELKILASRFDKKIIPMLIDARTIDDLVVRLSPHLSVDLLVLVHGPMYQKKTEETVSEDWKEMMDWNVHLAIDLTLEARKAMKSGGTIIYFGFDQPPYKTNTHTAAYVVAKKSLLQFIHQYAPVLYERHIRSFCIAPDFVDSPLLDEKQRKRWISYAETGFLLDPEDIAEGIRWILDAPPSINRLVVPIKKWRSCRKNKSSL